MLTWGDAGWRINENPTHYLCNIFVYVKSEIFQNKTLKFLKNISPYGYYCRTWRLLRKPPKGNRKSLTNCKMCHLGQQSPKQQIHLCGGHPPAPRPTRGSLWITCSIEAGGVGGGRRERGRQARRQCSRRRNYSKDENKNKFSSWPMDLGSSITKL